MSEPRQSLELVVDEVVLRGVPPERAPAVAAALEAGLTAFAESSGGVPLASRAEAFRRLPTVAAPAASPAALGDAVAEAVWSAIGGGER
jgi:hypothetical protein